MKYSIIIPLYNKQTTIRRAICSVFAQDDVSLSDIEVIVVNDGSTDGSAAEVERLHDENTHWNLSIHSQENAGVSSARNLGASLASHDYLCFLDSDDSYKPGFLSEISSLISSFPDAGIHATSYEFIDSLGGQTKSARLTNINPSRRLQLLENFFESAATGDLPFCASSICVPKPVFNSVSGFQCGENMGEDQDFYVKIALHYPIAVSQRPCANYFIGICPSLMDSVEPSAEMPFSKRLQSQLDKGLVPQHLHQGVKRYIAGHLRDLARRNLVAGKPKIAKQLILDPRARANIPKWLYWLIRIHYIGYAAGAWTIINRRGI